MPSSALKSQLDLKVSYYAKNPVQLCFVRIIDGSVNSLEIKKLQFLDKDMLDFLDLLLPSAQFLAVHNKLACTVYTAN